MSQTMLFDVCDYSWERSVIYRSACINIEAPKEFSLIYDLNNTFHLRPQKEKVIHIKTYNVYNAWINLFKIQVMKVVLLNSFYQSYHLHICSGVSIICVSSNCEEFHHSKLGSYWGTSYSIGLHCYSLPTKRWLHRFPWWLWLNCFQSVKLL